MKYLLHVLFICLSVNQHAFASEWKDKTAHKIQFIEMSDGINLEVLEWSSSGKETIVLLAGLTLNAHTYDNFASDLIKNYRVIGITRIGHGNSDVPKEDFSTKRLANDIITVLEKLDVGEAIFIGHSFAGSELTHLGRYYPERVKALIYVDAVQALEYLPDVQKKCPDIGQASIDTFKFKENFYNTQRIEDESGNHLPFADMDAIEKLFDQVEFKDYSGIKAPAIAINHLPEETINLLLGVGNPKQDCFEFINKMNYLGIAQFIKEKPNADVAAIQNSQHMIHMVTPNKLAAIINRWLTRTLENNNQFQSITTAPFE